MDRYRAVARESRRNGERNDCTVVATSIVTGLRYGKVLERFYDHGRRYRQGFKLYAIFPVIWSLGYCVTDFFEYDARTIGKLKLPKGRFIVAVSHHVFAVVDGVVEDPYVKRHPRARIRAVYQVHESPSQELAARSES